MLKGAARGTWRWRGGFEIALVNRVSGEIETVWVPNTITDDGLALTISLWAGTDVGWGYLAIGTDPTPAAFNQHQLIAEAARKPVSLEVRAGELLATVFFDDNEANIHIRELGLFGGNAATAALNSGILVARTIVDVNKSNLHSLTITRRDMLARG